MFATIKNLIPEPRQADQPRNYVGRHRQPETVSARAAVPPPAPALNTPATVSFLIAAQTPAEPPAAAAPAPRRTPSPRPAPEADAPAEGQLPKAV